MRCQNGRPFFSINLHEALPSSPSLRQGTIKQARPGAPAISVCAHVWSTLSQTAVPPCRSASANAKTEDPIAETASPGVHRPPRLNVRFPLVYQPPEHRQHKGGLHAIAHSGGLKFRPLEAVPARPGEPWHINEGGCAKCARQRAPSWHAREFARCRCSPEGIEFRRWREGARVSEWAA